VYLLTTFYKFYGKYNSVTSLVAQEASQHTVYKRLHLLFLC